MKHAVRLTASIVAAAALAGVANAQNVRILGRAEVNPQGGFTIQWPSSGFEATFTGPTLKAAIYDWGSNWLNVEVDGAMTKLSLDEETKTYTLFDGQPGQHTIRVTRRTGAQVGATRINSIEAEGLQATKASERRILVIGDSYASGFGVEGANETCKYSHDTQNAELAYPALLAKEFGADIHVAAVDGAGLTSNYSGDGPAMNTLAWHTLPDESSRAWAALAYQPQVVIVGLGTYDFTKGDPGQVFDDAYVFMLKRLRQAYPDALIVGAVGGSLWGKRYLAEKTSVADAVEFVRNSGDPNVAFVEFTPTNGPGRYGCEFHPGARAQAEMAERLGTEIGKRLGWKPVAAVGIQP